jgi:purine-binding chemotaxis protein CheW
MQHGSDQFATFELDGHLFGIEVTEVQEVIRYQPMSRVPLAPREIEGLINLRGQIVTAMDLRRRLSMPDRPAGELPMNVVVRTADGLVSLLVDEIGDVVEVTDATFERPPETLTGVARTLIRGAYKLEGRLLLVLDIHRTVALTTAA